MVLDNALNTALPLLIDLIEDTITQAHSRHLRLFENQKFMLMFLEKFVGGIN